VRRRSGGIVVVVVPGRMSEGGLRLNLGHSRESSDVCSKKILRWCTNPMGSGEREGSDYRRREEWMVTSVVVVVVVVVVVGWPTGDRGLFGIRSQVW
jgi:hypothetical protein